MVWEGARSMPRAASRRELIILKFLPKHLLWTQSRAEAVPHLLCRAVGSLLRLQSSTQN